MDTSVIIIITIMLQLSDNHPLLKPSCLSLLPPCSLLGDTETSPWGAKKQTAHDFWPGHESCRWTTGAASTRGKRELSFGKFYIYIYTHIFYQFYFYIFNTSQYTMTMKILEMFWGLIYSLWTSFDLNVVDKTTNYLINLLLFGNYCWS